MSMLTRFFLTLSLIFLITVNLLSQPEPPGSPHGSNENSQNGGSAPVGEGLGVLLVLSSLYAARKIKKADSDIIEN